MTVARLECPEELNQDTGRDLLAAVRERIADGATAVTLDLASTKRMDTRGGAWLLEIARLIRRVDGELSYEGQSGSVAEFMELIGPGLEAAGDRRKKQDGIFEEIGGRGLGVLDEARDFLNLIIDAIYWTFIGPVEGRGLRWGLVVNELYEMGVRALWINSLMNFLLGLIIAMLSAAQLRQVGLDIFVADLTVISFARELAAVMTAVVVAARTGAAIAAELATMKVQEEIDALRGMGLKVPQFLVAPRVIALVVAMPCLTAIGMVMGVLGGATWGVPVLGISMSVWMRQTLNAAMMGDIVQGLIKSVCFAVAIVLVGCHNGLRVRGGARGVGLMTTRAVVMDVFLIIMIDMVFAVVFYYVL